MTIKIRKFLANVVCGFIPFKETRRYVRNIINFGIIRCIFTIRAESKLSFPQFLSIVAIAKNEGSYFKEWIEYHRLVGVEKFYIYDNESNDDTKEILRPYIERGIVEYIYFPGEKQQMPAYEDCLRRHKYDTKWLAIIDLDEFIVPVETETVRECLEKLPKNVAQVKIDWVIYGSNGHEKKPSGLVIENYTKRAKQSWLFKSIVNPRLTIGSLDCHENHVLVNTIHKTINECRIHHYHCKSWEEYKKKSIRGDVYYGQDAGIRKYQRDLFNTHDLNEVYDPIMEKYISIIKANIQRENEKY